MIVIPKTRRAVKACYWLTWLGFILCIPFKAAGWIWYSTLVIAVMGYTSEVVIEEFDQLA